EDWARGDCANDVERVRAHGVDPAACALEIKALANFDVAAAERACSEAIGRHSLSAELHYLHAVLLLEMGRVDEAAGAARRAIYLDRTLAVVHFLLGTILSRGGDSAGSWRAYRNARDLCVLQPA